MERYRTTLILIGVLIVLGVVALMLNNRGTTPGGTPTATPGQFVWQEPNPVVGIDVVSGTQRVSLRKDITTTVWSLLEPISDTADVFAVGGVADNLQNLAAQRELTGTTDLAEFGLAGSPMRVTVTFSDTARTQRVLLVGGATMDGGALYTKREDSANVYLVGNFTLEPLRTWLTTPPKAQPTATPIPVTAVPTATVTPIITGTVTLTGTTPLTGTLPITNTNPGSANPTTPLPATVQPAGTPVP